MMLFVPPYARTNNRAMITQAFEPKTLMGLAGCGCSGAAGADGVMRNLSGLGVANDPAAQRAYCADINNRTLVTSNGQCWDTCYKDGVPLESTKLDPTDCGIGTFFPVDTTKPSQPVGGACTDTGLWKTAKDIQGRCINYCSADPLQYAEVEAQFCTKAGGGIPTNVMILGAVGIGIFLMMVTQ